jgi:hypothetical protein
MDGLYVSKQIWTEKILLTGDDKWKSPKKLMVFESIFMMKIAQTLICESLSIFDGQIAAAVWLT